MIILIFSLSKVNQVIRLNDQMPENGRLPVTGLTSRGRQLSDNYRQHSQPDENHQYRQNSENPSRKAPVGQ